MTAETTVILVTFNSAEALRWHHEHSAARPTLVVDNASRDGTPELAEELGYAVLRLPANVGYGRAIMAGLSEVDSEFALVLNPDAAIDADGADALVAAAGRYPDCDLFVPRIVDEEGRVTYRVESSFEPRQRYRRPPEGEACVPVISGAAMFIRVKPFLAFGGFDPAIFLYFEEDELCLRYRAARRAIIHVPEATVVHLRDRSSGAEGGASRIKDVSFGWSRAYVIGRHGRGSPGLVFVGMLGKLCVYVLSGRRQRAKRQWGRIAGFASALRGRPAPFMPRD